jgi:hypothetical protein
VKTAAVLLWVVALSTPIVLIAGLFSFGMRRAGRGGHWLLAVPIAQAAWSGVVVRLGSV